MEVAVREQCPPHASQPGPGPEAGAGHGSQAGLGSPLRSLPLGHCCARPMPALAPPQSKAWCQAWLSLPQGFPRVPLQPLPPSLSLTCRHLYSSGCPSQGCL